MKFSMTGKENEMKFSMTGQDTDDCLIEVTTWSGLTYSPFECYKTI